VQVCSRCIYDESIPSISFDSEGVCNYCRTHEQLDIEYPTGTRGEGKLNDLAERIRREGRGKEFDCVVGVSGGCDSSYLLWLAKEKLGLRPLAVHFDNTWDSKIAVENLHRMLKALDIPLYTYVMDNDEFNDLARAFLKASVPETDAISDIGLVTTWYKAAEKYKVKYILMAHSFRTEGMPPIGWVYFDAKYIDTIHKHFGAVRMKHFPNLWLSSWIKWMLKGIKQYRPLWYVDYVKSDVMSFLKAEFGWQWYGQHHAENIYTAFCNYYLLPKKFGMDLRFVELSALVRSGQMSREDALRKVSTPAPLDDEIVAEAKKRLGLTDEELQRILELPRKTHQDYTTYHRTFRYLRPIFWLLYKADRVPKAFYMKYTR